MQVYEDPQTRSLKILLVSLLLFLSAAFSWSQTGTSTVRGTITDPQGRVVAGATVTLTNVATNTVRTTKSTDTGTYVFDLITPAEYRLTAEAQSARVTRSSLGCSALSGWAFLPSRFLLQPRRLPYIVKRWVV